MILITPAYPEPHDARRAELREALARNIQSRLFTKIIVAAEGNPQYLPAGVAVVNTGRPTYRDLFELAPPGPVVVANSDIFFDATLKKLAGYDLRNKLLCISRREVDRFGRLGKLHNPYRSQDAWIFNAPLKPFPCGFPLGVMGCDQRLAYEAGAAGLAVSNPCLTIGVWHLHFSGVRRHTKARLPGRYARLAPCSL